MTFTVEHVGRDPAARAAWDAYVERHPDATTYHQSAWWDIFCDGLGYESFPLLARDASGSVGGVLTLYLVTSPLQRRLVAVPFRDRGGPIWDDEEALNVLLECSNELARRLRAGVTILKTLKPLPENSRLHGLTRLDHWVRSVLDLTGLNEAVLWDRIGNKTRNKIRQASAHGLEMHHADDSGAVNRWHMLHLRTQQRLGLPPFPRRFFARMMETLHPGTRIEMLEAVRHSQAHSAIILFFHKDTCIYGYSASTPEAQKMRANDMLVHGAIRLAFERGMRRFDFGSDSPRQESLLSFKRKWGAKQSVIPTYTTDPAAELSDSSANRYTFARSMLRFLPTGLLNALGNRVTRYFG